MDLDLNPGSGSGSACVGAQEGTKALNALEREQNNYWLSGEEGAGLPINLESGHISGGMLLTLPPIPLPAR